MSEYTMIPQTNFIGHCFDCGHRVFAHDGARSLEPAGVIHNNTLICAVTRLTEATRTACRELRANRTGDETFEP